MCPTFKLYLNFATCLQDKTCRIFLFFFSFFSQTPEMRSLKIKMRPVNGHNSTRPRRRMSARYHHLGIHSPVPRFHSNSIISQSYLLLRISSYVQFFFSHECGTSSIGATYLGDYTNGRSHVIGRRSKHVFIICMSRLRPFPCHISIFPCDL